jgi:tetratricopeptide (TPR) repeat protein
LDDAERNYLHEAVGSALEQLYCEQTADIAGQLAWHFREAGLVEKEIVYLRQAGDHAQRLVALDEAIRYYRTALERWPDADQAGRAETLRQLGECLLVTGLQQEALTTFEAAYTLFESLDDQLGAAASQRQIGRLYYVDGQREESRKHYQRALAILEQGPESVELARATSAISQMHMLASEYDQAISWGERALAMAERLDAADVTMHALNNLGESYVELGDPKRGQAMLQDSLQRALTMGLPYDACRAYYNLGCGLLWIGQHEQAKATLEEMTTYATQTHTSMFTGFGLLRLVELEWLIGDWAAAISRRQQLLEAIGHTEAGSNLKFFFGTLSGWMFNDLGRPGEALKELDPGLRLAESLNDLFSTVPFLGQLGRAYAALGRESETKETIQSILQLIDRHSHSQLSIPTFILFACHWQAAQSTPAALAAARASLERLERADAQISSLVTEAVLSEGRASVALAEGKFPEAVERFRHAVDCWEGLGRPYDRLRALNGYGRSLLQLEEFDEAWDTFDRALSIVEMLAAQLENIELQTSFLNSQLVQEVRDARAGL